VADVGSWARTVARRRGPLLVGVGLLMAGYLAGYLAGSVRESQAARGRHAATAVTLTGRVIVSNMGSRWIIFTPTARSTRTTTPTISGTSSGTVGRMPTAASTRVTSIRRAWFGSGGVEANPRRVELTTIDWDNGTAQPMHVALRVRCLD
jgi:hypothetical protein